MTLGGTIGTIRTSVQNPSGQTVNISGPITSQYIYFIYSATYNDLTYITINGIQGVPTANFTKTVVGGYKVYRSNTVQNISSGNTQTYYFTI